MHKLFILLVAASSICLNAMQDESKEIIPEPTPIIDLINKIRKDCNAAPHLDALKKLLKEGENPNEQQSNGTTALILLCEGKVFNSASEAVRILLAHGANPKLEDGRGWTALDWLNEILPWCGQISERSQIQNALNDSMKEDK